MYGVFSLVGWSMYALMKILEGILRAAWWICKTITKGSVGLIRRANGQMNRISVRGLSQRGLGEITQIRSSDMRTFDRQAKLYGVKYAIPRGQRGKDMLDIIILQTDIPKINHIFGKMQRAQEKQIGGDIKREFSRDKASVFGRVEGIKQSLTASSLPTPQKLKGVMEK